MHHPDQQPPGAAAEGACAHPALSGQAAAALLDVATRTEALLSRQRWLPEGPGAESALLRDARRAIAAAAHPAAGTPAHGERP